MSITQLPPEVLLNIFLNLPPLEFFGSVAPVCRHWSEITRTALSEDGKIPVEVGLIVSAFVHYSEPVTAKVSRLFGRFKVVRGVVGGVVTGESPPLNTILPALTTTKLVIANVSLRIPSRLVRTTPVFTNLALVVDNAATCSNWKYRLIRRGLEPVLTAVDVASATKLVANNAGGLIVGFTWELTARFALRTVKLRLDLITTWIRDGLLPVHSVIDATVYWITATRSAEPVFIDLFVAFPNLQKLHLGSNYDDTDNTKLLQAVADYGNFSAPESLVQLQTRGFNHHLPAPSWLMVLAQLLTRFPNLTTLGDLVLFDDTNEHWNGLAVTIPQHVFPSFAFPPGTSNGWAHPRIRNLGVAIFPRWSGNDMCDTVVLSSFASVVARYFPAVESLSFTFMLPVPFKPLSNVPGVLKAWEEVVTVLPANRINFVGENVGLLLRNGEGVDVQVADTWRLFFEGIRRIGDRIGKKVEADGEF